ncbi:MAG: SPOR domain-containing protein [Candidatus Thiodiazotropha taylori]|nr:SPOR domain-containing protein [Candidatus Thiodiazotropha taylori]
MTREQKIGCTIGALAGITPLLVSLVSVDASLIVKVLVPAIIIGYVIKAAGLMALGAFVVFVNSESDYKKAFQLGLMAPALVVGALNANNFNEANLEINELQTELGERQSLGVAPSPNTSSILEGVLSFFIGSAHADEPMLIGKHDSPSTGNLIWYGISGKISNAWFVIVGSHDRQRDAVRQAEGLKKRGYNARVVPDVKNKENYVVSIGSYLDIKEAKALHKTAIRENLARHPYLWKWK